MRNLLYKSTTWVGAQPGAEGRRVILPGNQLKPDRALLSIGGEILTVMGETSTVSVLWDKVQALRSKREATSPLPFDWFLMALTRS
jgi:hypothetical protein